MKWLLIVLAACGHDVASAPDSALPLDAPQLDASPAQLQVVPTSIDFQTANVGCEVAGPVAIVVTNTGGVTTAAVAVEITGADASEFAVAPTSCAPLAPGEHCELQATFAPTSPGAKTASIAITAGPGASAMVSLTGVADSHGALTITPPGNTSFGNVAVGATSSPQVFTVANTCSAVTTGSLGVSLAGADPDQFIKTADTCTGTTLGPSATCSITLAFAPTSVGASAASIEVTAIPGGAVMASVSGVGLATPAPDLAMSPAAIDFGNVGAGQTSPDASSCFQPPANRLTVTNTGTVASASLTAVVSGAGFAIANDLCSGHSLDPGATCTIDATFTAGGTLGSQTGTLTVMAASLVVHADLTAEVVTDGGGFLSANPESLSFGTVTIGSTSATRSFTVANNGACPTGPLKLQTIGLDATEFTILSSSTCANATLASGQSCSVDIAFEPTEGLGSKTATAVVSGTPGGEVMVALDGVAGSTFPLAITPPSHDFGALDLDSCPTSFTFTVTNSGSVTYGPFATAIVGADSASFAIGPDSCSGASLPHGGMCTVTVAFAPMPPAASKAAALQVGVPGLSVQAALSGSALSAAGLAASPCTLAFGTVAPGASATRTIAVTNDGATTTGPIQVSVSGPDAGVFSATNDTCTNAMLANGQGCSVDIVFAPIATSPATATATIGTVSVALTGD